MNSTILHSDTTATLIDQSDISTRILQNIDTLQYLIGLGDLNGKTLIHIAANSNNPDLLDTLITYCGLPLNAIANKQWQQLYAEGTKKLLATPLSLILTNSLINDMVKLLVKKQSISNCLTHVDISYAKIAHISEELFKLQHISHLNASHNKIKDLPFSQMVSKPSNLCDLNLSYNLLTTLPIEIFAFQNLKKLDASHNPLVTLPEKWWLSKSLVSIDLSYTQLNRIFQFEPNQTQSMTVELSSSLGSKQRIVSRNTVLTESEECVVFPDLQLESSQLNHLKINHCCIEKFPKCFACFFPRLKYLEISGNNIKSCCTVNELPGSLLELNISHNNLHSKDQAVFCLSSGKEDCYCHTGVASSGTLRCSHMRHNKLAHLNCLNLSNNANIEKVILHYINMPHNNCAKVELFFPKLRKLFLNNCNLIQCPAHLDKMADIYSLHIGHNKFRISSEISNLERLLHFSYDGLTDPLVSVLDKFTTVEEKIKFLREKW